MMPSAAELLERQRWNRLHQAIADGATVEEAHQYERAREELERLLPELCPFRKGRLLRSMEDHVA